MQILTSAPVKGRPILISDVTVVFCTPFLLVFDDVFDNVQNLLFSKFASYKSAQSCIQ